MRWLAAAVLIFVYAPPRVETTATPTNEATCPDDFTAYQRKLLNRWPKVEGHQELRLGNKTDTAVVCSVYAGRLTSRGIRRLTSPPA